jgi:hypothetical protein
LSTKQGEAIEDGDEGVEQEQKIENFGRGVESLMKYAKGMTERYSTILSPTIVSTTLAEQQVAITLAINRPPSIDSNCFVQRTRTENNILLR